MLSALNRTQNIVVLVVSLAPGVEEVLLQVIPDTAVEQSFGNFPAEGKMPFFSEKKRPKIRKSGLKKRNST